MSRLFLILVTVLFLIPTAAYGQSLARLNQPVRAEGLFSRPENEAGDDQSRAALAIAALKRLESGVLVYRSLGDFEADGRLARVSFEVFSSDLHEVAAEVAPLLSRLPQGKLRTEISNALESYRDGAFWWRKIYQPRIVQVSALTSVENTRTPSDTALLATVPYTVAIHWRQAGKYLQRAEEMANVSRK